MRVLHRRCGRALLYRLDGRNSTVSMAHGLHLQILMPTPAATPVPKKLSSVPIRDLGLRIEGTPLEEVIHEFLGELEHVGIGRLRPHFYLSTEWGVPFGTVSIAMPFY